MSDQILSYQSPEITLTSRWERASHVMVFPSGNDYALHDMDLDEYFVLPGPVAGLVWDLCDGITSVEEMLEKITANFDVERETAWADLQEFLGQLQQQGVITPL